MIIELETRWFFIIPRYKELKLRVVAGRMQQGVGKHIVSCKHKKAALIAIAKMVHIEHISIFLLLISLF